MHYEKFQDGTVKCIEDEIPFEVPDGWEWTRIFSISNELPYGTAKKSEPSGKVIVLRMGNIQNGEVDYSDLVYSSDDSDIEKYNLTPGDLLFNRTNSSEWVGKTSIYRGDFPAIYAGYIIRLRTPLNPEYLNSVMNSSYAYQYCRMVKTDGVNQSNINAQKLGAFLVPVAPKAEQIMIANKISDILPQIDSITECKTSLEETVSYVKSKVLDLAIRGKLVAQNPDDESASVLLERIRTEKEDLIKQGKLKRDKKDSIIYKGDDNSYYEKFNDGTLKCIDNEIPYAIPLNWEWCRLGSIGNWQSGATPSRRHPEYYGGDIPWLKTGDLNDEYIDDVSEYITDEGFKNSSVVMNPIGSVLIAMYGATIGKLGITNIETTTNQACCACFPLMISNKYLFFFLMHEKENFIKNAVGGAQPNISKEKIVGTLIPIPPLDEQNRIVKTIESLNGFLSLIEASLI